MSHRVLYHNVLGFLSLYFMNIIIITEPSRIILFHLGPSFVPKPIFFAVQNQITMFFPITFELDKANMNVNIIKH